MKRIKIFDTTLRDGEQSPGCSMNLTEKIEMARQLEKLGVDVIEAGFAIASPMDHKSVQAIAAAVTLAELEAVGRAAVLIPSPNVAENHQYYNAMELQKAGAAVVIEEKDLTGEKLVQTVSAMLAQPGKLAEMGKNARSLSVDDSLDRITAALLKLVKTP